MDTTRREFWKWALGLGVICVTDLAGATKCLFVPEEEKKKGIYKDFPREWEEGVPTLPPLLDEREQKVFFNRFMTDNTTYWSQDEWRLLNDRQARMKAVRKAAGWS